MKKLMKINKINKKFKFKIIKMKIFRKIKILIMYQIQIIAILFQKLIII